MSGRIIKVLPKGFGGVDDVGDEGLRKNRRTRTRVAFISGAALALSGFLVIGLSNTGKAAGESNVIFGDL